MGVYDDYKQCYGKKAYTYSTAQRVCNERSKNGQPLRIYFCHICQKYHLTKVKPEGDDDGQT